MGIRYPMPGTSGETDMYGTTENKMSDVLFSDASFSYELTYWVIYAGAGLILGSFIMIMDYLL